MGISCGKSKVVYNFPGDPFGNVSGNAMGGKVFRIGIDEDSQMIESKGFDKFEKDVEIRVGFSRETDDDRCTERTLREGAADPVIEAAEGVPVVVEGW